MISRVHTFITPDQDDSTHLPVNRVGGGDDATPRVQTRMDPGLGDGDRLLFHDFVNGDPIYIRHLVKLVDTHHAPVG